MQSTYNAAKSLKQRWFIKEAYPLYAVIGIGSAAAAAMLTRTFFYNPDTRYMKKYRGDNMVDDPRDLERGSSFYDHPIRRMVRGRHPSILPPRKYVPDDEDDK